MWPSSIPFLKMAQRRLAPPVQCNSTKESMRSMRTRFFFDRPRPALRIFGHARATWFCTLRGNAVCASTLSGAGNPARSRLLAGFLPAQGTSGGTTLARIIRGCGRLDDPPMPLGQGRLVSQWVFCQTPVNVTFIPPHSRLSCTLRKPPISARSTSHAPSVM